MEYLTHNEYETKTRDKCECWSRSSNFSNSDPLLGSCPNDKHKRIRRNRLGKRTIHSGRTIVTPDPTILVNELGVPISIIQNMSFSETITPSNTDISSKTDLDMVSITETITHTGSGSVSDINSDINSDIDTDIDTEPPPDPNIKTDDAEFYIVNMIKDFLKYTMGSGHTHIISSPHTFDTFLSFITTFTACTNIEFVTQCLFYVGCSYQAYQDIGIFMLENSKYSKAIIGEIMGFTNCSPLDEICRLSNYRLFKCFIKHVPNYMLLLTQGNSKTKPSLFYIESIQLLEHLVKTNNFTESVLINTVYNGLNYFHQMIYGVNNDIIDYLLKLDVCTRKVIINVVNWEKLFLQIFDENDFVFGKLIESGKLSNEDFENDYNGEPLFYKFLERSYYGKADPFLKSPYCTVSHVEKYINDCCNLDEDPDHGITRLFTYEKFMCLKDKYVGKKSSVANEPNTKTKTKTNETRSDNIYEILQNLIVEVKQLKEEIHHLKNSNC